MWYTGIVWSLISHHQTLYNSGHHGWDTPLQWRHNEHNGTMAWRCHFPCYWPFVRGIHRSPVNSPHKGQWHGALLFSLICALNKRLSKQSWGWWFEMPSRSLWRHCNDYQTILYISYCMYWRHLQARVSGIWTTNNSHGFWWYISKINPRPEIWLVGPWEMWL